MFVYKTLNKKIENPTYLMELLNAIGIIENLSWKEVYALYIHVLKTYANGPSDDVKNVRMLLKETGYSPLFDATKIQSRALVRRGNHFYALIKDGNFITQYGICDPSYLEEYDEYDLYIKSYNYNYSKLQKKKQETFQDSFQYSYTNLNPRNKIVGDCSIRALAGALQVSWMEAVDILAKEAIKKNQVYINHEVVVESVLSKLGFQKYPHFPYKLTCAKFCEKMDEQYDHARILLYAGKNHIVYLSKENHKYCIKDTWDSSAELAGDYFVKEEKSIEETPSLVEKIIVHPLFGEGIVEKQEKKNVWVAFSEESKLLQWEWIKNNCEILDL